MKSTVVDESLSITITRVLFQRETTYLLQVYFNSINISHLETIAVLTQLWPLLDYLFGRHISSSLFMPIFFWNCRHVYIYKILMPWSIKLTDSNIFGSNIFFLNIYDPFSTQCLEATFPFWKCLLLLQFINISHLAGIAVLSLVVE